MGLGVGGGDDQPTGHKDTIPKALDTVPTQGHGISNRNIWTGLAGRWQGMAHCAGGYGPWLQGYAMLSSLFCSGPCNGRTHRGKLLALVYLGKRTEDLPTATTGVNPQCAEDFVRNYVAQW